MATDTKYRVVAVLKSGEDVPLHSGLNERDAMRILREERRLQVDGRYSDDVMLIALESEA